MQSVKHWYQSAAIYHIYPRSFYDASGDGVGDLRGIADRLDYLAGKPDSLGINAIWLSPFYPSPMVDFGYDVSDYTDVDPLFGTMDDFEYLVREAHARGIKVLIDFVPNHTSDKHAWFQESRSSRDNPKRDWYTWGEPDRYGGPPNNWLSVFGGSAWEWDETTGQFYLHSFLKEQPDINWSNPEVREAMKTSLRFWLDKGVDGFRIDATHYISKDMDMRDDPPNPHFHPDFEDPYHANLPFHSSEGPHLYEYLKEITNCVSEYPERFMITEVNADRTFDSTGQFLHYYAVAPEVSAPINFKAIFIPWEPRTFRSYLDSCLEEVPAGGIQIFNLSNHDHPRIASRYGAKAARTAAMLHLCLPGMPVIYYGDELGMANVPIPADRVQDPFEKNVPGKGLGRDPQRTPLPWSAAKNAGFSIAEPWLPVNDDYETLNVEVEKKDDASIWHLYKSLLDLRNTSDTLKYGRCESYSADEDTFVFSRTLGTETLYVVLNYSLRDAAIQDDGLKGKIIMSTFLDREAEATDGTIALRPHEGLIIRAS